MLWRIEVGLKSHVKDVHGKRVSRKIREELGLEAGEVRTIKVYTVEGLEQNDVDKVLELGALHDPVLHDPSLKPLASGGKWYLEVGFRPGVTDNEGRTAQETLATVLGLSGKEREKIKVYTSTQFIFDEDLELSQVEFIAGGLLANKLIQRYEIKSAEDWNAAPGFEAKAARVTGQASDEVAIIPLSTMSDAELVDFSRSNTLALNLEEMQRIRDYFAAPERMEHRKSLGLGIDPTDAELEALAQTWSEHCKHKIFSSKIDYENKETGVRTTLDSLYKTCIQKTTQQLRDEKGDDDYCLSVFKDNAGVIKFSDKINVCVKMETHNSPSALDPYGGALTGIVGVNRDPMGTGMGANLLCNTDVFCFASPFHEGELPPRLLHPRRVFEGVREGVEHGGNKSGIPTVNGSMVFDERYLGKPLVYCGTVGTMPVTVAGKPSHEKKALPGDIIVMAGGRIGKDGIHGATFSSEELHEGSPATAVQIGDPITQRKMYDCLMRARDLGLYNAITDNGAGGLSSSVGEMAEDCNGCDLDLAKAPLKYDGLRPWEILVSEAQERMTLAVPPEKLDQFMALAEEMDVEATALGTYVDSGYYNIRYGDKPVASIGMDFLHDGVPQMELKAVWERPVIEFSGEPEVEDHSALLLDMLGRLNICSKEYLVRQYDHEVQGKSVVKPMVGERQDGPSDAGVLRPDLESEKGLVVSHGICPKFSDLDTYWMMANAIDEAVRNAVAVGADIDYMAGVDNFCWCDPVQSESTPDGHYKLAQLVRANLALSHFCRSYGVPCISGKDSMKNDYKGGGVKISIPPTVLFSVIGVIPDVSICVTSDFKKPGDLVYLLGRTRNELGGTEIASQLGFSHNLVPRVEALEAVTRYRTLHQAMRKGYISACHDLSDGGLAVALAEMSIGGRVGAEIDICSVPREYGLSTLSTLYSETPSRMLVTVDPANAIAFEEMFAGQTFARIGMTTGLDSFGITEGMDAVVRNKIAVMAKAFKDTLDW